MPNKISTKQLHEQLRNDYMEMTRQFLIDHNEEVLLVGSNEFAIPCVDKEGNEEFIVLTFKVPTGSRDGTPYDGYGEAEAFKLKTEEKAEKTEKAKIAKAEKIAKDKAMREAKAKARAEHQGK